MSNDRAAARPLADIPMDRQSIDRLAARGLISAEARELALDLMSPPRRWGLWTGRLLGVTGAALVLSGLVYFFAFNWARIPPLVKLGSIGALLAAACLTVAVRGFERRGAEPAAVAAVTLVGVFLAVEGQIYQTGADAWTLFAAWAALSFPFALLACSAATWAVWLAVAAVALATVWDQTQPADAVFHAGRNLSLMALFAVALALREGLAMRGVSWPAARWTRFVVALPLLAAATQLALMLLGDGSQLRALEVLAAGLIVLAFAALGVTYRYLKPDVAMLAAIVTALCVVADFALLRLVAGRNFHADLGTFLLMGLATLALFAAAIAWLRAAARRMEVRP